VWARASWDGNRRRATVIEHRVASDGGGGVEYYVHYAELNKRLDEWIDGDGVEAFKDGESAAIGDEGVGANEWCPRLGQCLEAKRRR
jgi:hypothetical protein